MASLMAQMGQGGAGGAGAGAGGEGGASNIDFEALMKQVCTRNCLFRYRISDQCYLADGPGQGRRRRGRRGGRCPGREQVKVACSYPFRIAGGRMRLVLREICKRHK